MSASKIPMIFAAGTRKIHSKANAIPLNTASSLFLKCRKENPNDAMSISHSLLIKAGFIQQTGAGIFTLMPLAVKVLDKIEKIVANELGALGCARIAMPSLQPAQLWEKSGRWKAAGPELFRVTDRKGSRLGLGPTSEEVVTEIVARELSTFRQLPLRLYQMNRKFRDELRPRSGLLRGREFVMKDLYTFDESPEAAMHTYEIVKDAYRHILSSIGIDFVCAEADTGQMGGALSHEWLVLSEDGEDTVMTCDCCGYTANQEKASSLAPDVEPKKRTEELPLINQTREILKLLGLENSLTVGPLAETCTTTNQLGRHEVVAEGYWAEDSKATLIVAVLRAGHTANCTKVANAIGARFVSPTPLAEPVLRMASTSDIGVKLLVDSAVAPLVALPSAQYGDFRLAQDGDPCWSCGHPIRARRGIEVGHTFYLSTRYSVPFKCRFIGRDDKLHMAEMGCYGLGLTRLLAAVVECHHDEHGIVWPMAVAPFKVCIVTLGSKKAGTALEVFQSGCALYTQLVGILPHMAEDILLDDRHWLDSGTKITEARLVGYPVVLLVNQRTATNRTVEVELRAQCTDKSERQEKTIESVVEMLRQISPGL